MGEKVLPQAPLAGQVNFGISSIDVQNNLAPSVSRHPNRKLGRFGTAALSLVLASCGGNTGGPAPALTDGGSHPETPGIILSLNEAPDSPESIDDRFDTFFAEYHKQVIKVNMVKAWVESLGIPFKTTLSPKISEYYPFYIFDDSLEPEASKKLKKYFEVISRGDDNMPRKGDIIIGQPNDYTPLGKLTISTGEGQIDSDGFRHVKVFSQGDTETLDLTQPNEVFDYNLWEALGWVRAKQVFNSEDPDTLVAGGDAIDGGSETGNASEAQREIDKLFDAFLAKYEGQDIEQKDIVSIWVDSLGISSDEIYDFLFDAGPFERFNNPPDYIKEKYEVILNDNWDKLPQKGDIVFTYPNSNNGAGIMVIVAEDVEKDSNDVRQGKVFANYNVNTQDFRTGWIPRIQDFNIEEAVAWLRPILTNDSEDPDTLVAGGDVVDEESETGNASEAQNKIDKLFDAFLAENLGTDNINNDRHVVLRWFDTLKLPEEALIGTYDDVKEVFDNPTEITKEFFEIIPNTEGARPKSGDILIRKPNIDKYEDLVGIATGKEIDDTEFEAFASILGSERLTKFSPEDTYGWLRPKAFGEPTGETENTEGEVLGVSTESIHQILNNFIKEVEAQNGGYLDYDKAYGYQCVDTTKLWSKTLGGPEMIGNAIELFGKYPEFYESIPNPKDGSQVPQAGDIVIWDAPYGKYVDDIDGITKYAGHAAISTGKVEKRGGEYFFEAFGQNYPIDSPNILQDFALTDKVKGWMRPKSFDSASPATEEPNEFVLKNESEFARFHFSRFLMKYFNESVGGSVGYWIKWTDLSEEDFEKIIWDFAKNGTTNSIPVYEISYNTHHDTYSPPDPDLYLYDDNGDIYEEEMQIVKGFIKRPTLNLSRSTDSPEPRNGYRVAWEGKIEFRSQIESGIAQITARGTLEDFQRWNEGDSNFPGFDKITDTNLETGGHKFKVYIYENGDVECESYFTSYNNLGVCLDQGRFSIFNMFGWNAFQSLDVPGHNGEFVIEE